MGERVEAEVVSGSEDPGEFGCPIERLCVALEGLAEVDSDEREARAEVDAWAAYYRARYAADPLHVAWLAGTDAVWMRWVLVVAGRIPSPQYDPPTEHVPLPYAHLVAPELRCGWGEECRQEIDKFDTCPACADAVRLAHPTPPTLDELIAAVVRARA
jgi:hypothetical protein